VAATAPPQFPGLHEDWPLLRAALDELGMEGQPVVWSDPAVDWSAFDLVVSNGAWDNIHHPLEFLAWVEARERSGVPLVNSPATLRWNLDKRYLRELQAAGLPTVPTAWVEPHLADTLSAWPALACGQSEIVVKPSVSGGGYQTARYQPHEHESARLHVEALVEAGRTAMIQPYVAAVDTEGETALIFLGGTFSHAVHKDPMIRRGVAATDNLMENQEVREATATTAQLDVGRRSLATAERLLGQTTYARVDLVPGADDGSPAVLELELLDPVLFLATHPAAASTFARVLQDCLNASGRAAS
jgi:glutathione synthase/RimK-type ligase-like ATP-grasp enzyme